MIFKRKKIKELEDRIFELENPWKYKVMDKCVMVEHNLTIENIDVVVVHRYMGWVAFGCRTRKYKVYSHISNSIHSVKENDLHDRKP